MDRRYPDPVWEERLRQERLRQKREDEAEARKAGLSQDQFEASNKGTAHYHRAKKVP